MTIERFKVDRVAIQAFATEIITDVITKGDRGRVWWNNQSSFEIERIHTELADKVEEWIEFQAARQ